MGASKILRQPGQPAQSAKLDHERRARSRAFRRKMHLFIAGARDERSGIEWYSRWKRLARMQEELFASVDVAKEA